MKSKSLSIGWKLSLSGILAIALILCIALSVVAAQLMSRARASGEQRLAETAGAVSTLLTGYDETFRKAALRDFGIYRALFPDSFELVEEIGPDGQPAPQLRHGGVVLNGNFDIVDRFTRSTGSAATVFARRGDDFVRITTSVKKEDGSRAVGTLLGKASPAYADMLEGRRRVDRFPLFGSLYMHVYEPIRQGDRTIGVLYIGVPMTDAMAQLAVTLQAYRLYESGRVYAVDLRPGAGQGRVFGLAEPQGLADAGAERAALLAALQASPAGLRAEPFSVVAGAKAAAREVRLHHVRNDAWNWAVVAEAPLDEIEADARSVIALFALAVAAAVVALGAVLVWLSSRLIARPVAALQAGLSRLAQGDLVHPLTARSNDEMGTLVRAMEAFRGTLVEAMSTVRGNAEEVNAASGQIAQGNSELSGRTSTQASALQQTAASMEQLGATIRHSADSARRADELAQGASRIASEGGAVVSQVVETMRGIDDSSRRIADIVGVVDAIAFQTNILALNAAVEAARAGEQGRGFAVVAAEVRSLAQRSAQAAREIKGLIGDSVEKVRAGSSLVVGAGETMSQIVASVRQVSQIIGEISVAAGEQDEGIGQVNRAVAQLDEATQRNAALVEQSAAAAESLKARAAQLSRAVQAFRLG